MWYTIDLPVIKKSLAIIFVNLIFYFRSKKIFKSTIHAPEHAPDATRTVAKAFLIKGGDEESREKKYRELIRGDEFYMYGAYREKDELDVIFVANHDDYKGMTFEKAKQLAGTNDLGSDFKTSTFGNEARRGIIDLSVDLSVKDEMTCKVM